jgi:hypothetical protein
MNRCLVSSSSGQRTTGCESAGHIGRRAIASFRRMRLQFVELSGRSQTIKTINGERADATQVVVGWGWPKSTSGGGLRPGAANPRQRGVWSKPFGLNGLAAKRGLARRVHLRWLDMQRSHGMNVIPTKPIRTAASYIMLSLLVACGFAFAQDQPEGPPPTEAPPQNQTSEPTPGWHRFSKPQSAEPPSADQSPAGSPDQPVSSQLTLAPGTFVTVRANQFLSSDRNQAGDGFSATLEQPLVVDGLMVAPRGETVGGRVAEAKKAGRVKGVSRLALQLTELTLVDGQLMRITTQLTGQTGPKSVGRDAGAVAGTTALGAAVGAAAEGGVGAAIGAGAGAVAATVGVLLTRGRPTEIYPESMLTFRIEKPVTISTARAPRAFRYVEPIDYERPPRAQGPAGPPRACGGYGCPPPYPYYGPPYTPYYWGPSLAFWYGPRSYYGRHFYGRGFYGYRR